MDTQIQRNEQKTPYPKSVFFVVIYVSCDYISSYSMLTILPIYLNYQLGYSTSTATVIYHGFNMFCFFFAIIGGIISDNYLGKFKTIIYLSMVYLTGNIIMSLNSIGQLNLPQRELTIISLLLIALGKGGISPCLMTFGGDHFVLPEQEATLQRFFSITYFAGNFAYIITTLVTPVLRDDIHCFGEDSCFFVAFGVSAVAILIALVSFTAGTSVYTMKTPEGNVIYKASKCIWHAVTTSNSTKKDHWLDKADDKFDKLFIKDIKAALRVIVLFIPLPIFWALFDQRGSRWTFQATRMSGDLGGGFILKPDQIHVMNPTLIMIFIALFESIVYPFLARFNLLKRPLQKIVLGGLCLAFSFVIAAVVELQLEGNYPVLPRTGSGQLRLYNVMGCVTSMKVNVDDRVSSFILEKMETWENLTIPVTQDERDVIITWTNCTEEILNTAKIKVFNGEATSYMINRFGNPYQSRNENVDKTEDGNPTIMTIFSSHVQSNYDVKISFIASNGKEEHYVNLNKPDGSSSEQFTKITSGKEYVIKINNNEIYERFDFKQGGGYVVLIEETALNTYAVKVHTIIKPNSINIMWIFPQYFLLTAAELFFIIPGLEFSFSQAPVSMKALVTAMWHLTTAFGNLIALVMAEAKIFDSQVYEFLLFAGLMLAAMFLFTLMAMRYKYVQMPDQEINQNEAAAYENNMEYKVKKGC